MPAAAWSLPVMPLSLSPGHTPKMVPTEKLVSTMELPSRGSKATLKPLPAQLPLSFRQADWQQLAAATGSRGPLPSNQTLLRC